MLANSQLVALRSISNGALKADQLPARLKLLDWGVNKSTEGDVICDNQTAQLFAANQKLIGRERIALDWEHNTVPGTEEFKRSPEPRSVAAYGAPVVIPGDGLWLEQITWTPDGQKAARNYEDLSPAPFRTAEGSVIGLHSAALTRAGAVTGLHFFSASPELDALIVTLSANNHSSPKSHPSHPMNNAITVTALAVALGLKPDAPESEVLSKITSLNALVTVLGALVKDGKLIPLSAPGGSSDQAMLLIENRLAAIEAGQTNSERNRLILDASRDGKVIPLSADDLKTVPISVLSAMVKNLPATVPLSARGAPPQEAARNIPDRGAELKGLISKYKTEHGCDTDAAFNAIRQSHPQLFN